LISLVFVVHAFGAAVVVRQGEGGIDCGAVLLEAPGESMQVGQVLGLGRGDPGAQQGGIAVGWIQQHGEVVDEVGQSGHFVAGGSGGLGTFPLVVLETVGAGEQVAGQAPGRQCGPVGLDTALVDVADQQVRAAGVTQFPDLPEEMGDGHGRILQPAPAQVISVGSTRVGRYLGARMRRSGSATRS
jgi:hypothetical protein